MIQTVPQLPILLSASKCLSKLFNKREKFVSSSDKENININGY